MRTFIAVVCLVVLLGPAAMAQDRSRRITALEARIEALEAQNAKLMERLDVVTTDVESSKKAAEEAKAPAAQPGGIAAYTSVGGDIRWRGVMFDNVWDYNSDGSYLDDTWEINRFRNRIWFDAKPLDNTRAYIRLTNEYRWGDTDYETFSNANPSFQDTKDIAIDNAFIEISNILDRNLTLKIGRQDIVFGKGFVFLDGTPFDGSETIGFDAIRLTYTLEDSDTTIDVFQAKTDEGLKEKADDEDVHGIYVKGNLIKGDDFTMSFEPYFLHRNRNNVDTYAAPWDTLTEPKLWTAMPGLRVSGRIYDNFAYSAEVAYQFGELEGFGSKGQDVDRDAWGGYAKGTYTFADASWKPSITAGFTYLSGDDPDSEDFEGWDTFYAEWPKFSELYIYSIWDPMPQAPGVDPDLGAWTNMYMPEVKLTVNPNEKLRLTLRYLYYWAVEDEFASDTFKRGDGRGHNPQFLAEYQFNKFLSGHVLAEYFKPGDYYDEEDAAYFMRTELMMKF